MSSFSGLSMGSRGVGHGGFMSIGLNELVEILNGYLLEYPERSKDKVDLTKIEEWLEKTDPDKAKRFEAILPKKFLDLDDKTKKIIEDLNIRKYYR